MTLQIDWNFIGQHEGYKTAAYWPGGASGVTVGHGIDLGYYSDTELHRLNELDAALAQKIEPYIDVMGVEANALVKLKPLTLTDAECLTLEIPKREGLLAGLRAACQRGGLVLEDLPAAVQTVLMDLTWQWGAPWYRCPTFWAYVCAMNWGDCIAELRNFHDDFPTRRNDEANIIEAGLPK
jgi:GH24 family phage-related lysozyme (muramidase)